MLLQTAYHQTLAAVRRRDLDTARGWLLVREYRPPTRFTRAPADATVALDSLASGRMSAPTAAGEVRADLLDTYDALLRDALVRVGDAADRGFAVRTAQGAALARRTGRSSPTRIGRNGASRPGGAPRRRWRASARPPRPEAPAT